MKFFLSFLQSSKHYPIPAYSFWQYYIKNGIIEAGHTWVEHPDADWALGLVPAPKESFELWKQEIWDKIIQYLKKKPVDVFLSYLYPEQIDKNAIKEIQNLGIPCVNFFCDHMREFSKIPNEFSAFDLNWVPEYKALPLYRQKGYPYIHLPMPIWVDPLCRVLSAEKNAAITFIGSKDIQRLLFFEEVVKLNPALPLAVYGNGWEGGAPKFDLPFEDSPIENYTFGQKLIYQYSFIKKNGVIPYSRKLKQRTIAYEASRNLKSKIYGSVSFDTYNKLTSESMLTLGINRYPSFRFPISRPGTYSRLRDIEAPMLGACYLTEQTEGIESLYDIGNEIELYTNAEDLIEKVKELQIDGKKRISLKINGQKRALQDHSVARSINKILNRLR